MSTDKEGIVSPPSKRNDVAYSINSYEDTRNANITMSYDPTEYIQKARVTRAQPPKPAYDPLQFVQLKPCSLVKTAQAQMQKADEVKKVKDEKKEEPEEWQCNLDNWKSSRRKRVEHIIDRVVEVKKFELEEHDRNRRKSKTFNEMMEERGSRRLKYLPIYTDDDNNDLSDLGINSSDVSSKEIDANVENSGDETIPERSAERDLNEYTYEGAIEGYKSRISRTTTHTANYENQRFDNNAHQKTQTGTVQVVHSSKEASLYTLEEKKPADVSVADIPKIDFLKRKELFEKEQEQANASESRRQSSDFVNTLSIKERLSVLQLNQAQETSESEKRQRTIPDVSFTDLKNRLEIFEREIRTLANDKDDLSSSSPPNTHESSVEPMAPTPKDEPKPEDDLLEKSHYFPNVYSNILTQKQTLDENENIDTDREDSGIHTTDVSCSVSQADDQNEEVEHLANDDSNNKSNPIEAKPHPSNAAEDSNQMEYDEANDISILDDALEMAFQEIDCMETTALQPINSSIQEPIYQNIADIEDIASQNSEDKTNAENEPYYQVPKSQEPYYEVPKTKPIPLYENVDMMQSVAIISDGGSDTNFTVSLNHQQPPKEKPPPPPIESKPDVGVCSEFTCNTNSENFKRINSTKRIKKELHNKRSSFLGIDTDYVDEDGFSNLSIAIPPRAAASILQEGKRLEKQYLLKTGLYDHSDAAESRDSGVSENHSRQSSDIFTTSSDDPEELIKPKIGEPKALSYRDYDRNPSKNNCFPHADDEFGFQTRESQLLQPEDLRFPIPPPIPPTKPLRSPQYLHNQYNAYIEHSKSLSNVSNLDYGDMISSTVSSSESQIAFHSACNNINTSNEILSICDQTRLYNNHHVTESGLDLTSCVPKSKSPIHWEQYRDSHESNDITTDEHPLHDSMLRQRSYTECSPQWNVKASRPANRNSDSYTRHWFVQEAEQRRIEQQQQAVRGNYASGYSQNKNRKSLPESVIQTITQRVQNLGIGSDRRWHPEGPCLARKATNDNGLKPEKFNSQSHQCSSDQDEKVLSVSGKKKCSHCNSELGRGAAMVIESLGLLYHIDCFKCCVCHIRLGDGFSGTDVRVRKYKLHCQNCFSSEDGIKFSCV